MRITVQLRYLLLAAAAFVAIGALLVATVQAQTPPPQDDKPSFGSEAESPPLPTPTPIPQDGPQDSGSDGEPRGTASDPTITIASYASPVTEGGTVYFRLTASSAPSAHVEINLQATGGTSFLTATPVNSIGLGPGLTVAWLILGTEDDTVDEPDGTITARILTGTGYSVGSPSSATITIEDNDDSPSRPPPTNLSISIEAGDDSDLDVAYTRSESPHYYQFELHRSTSRFGTYSLVRTVSDSISPADFDNQTKDHWYKARGRNCATSARTACGDWSAWSNLIDIPPDPTIDLYGLVTSMTEGDNDSFTVSASNLVSTHSYTIRVETNNSDVGFNSSCLDRQEEVTVPSGRTSYSTTFTLYGCDTSGGTVTATLRRGTTSVDTDSQYVGVTAPSIEIRNLATTLQEGQSDSFLVWASNLNTSHLYTFQVETDNSDIGFNATCSIRSRTQSVPSSSTSESAGFTLHACDASGGRATATLLRGGTTVDTDYQDVIVPSPAVFQFTPSPLALGGTSNVWTIPTGVTSVYVDVDFSEGIYKDEDAGDINVNRVNSFGTVLSTLAVDNEDDSRTWTGAADGSLIRIDVDNDAFDVSLALVTLTFHSGSDTTGPEIARATVQKESRPYAPTNGSGSVDATNGSVTLSWGPGAARLGSNPDHYEVVIPDTSNPSTPLYSNLNVDDSTTPTMLTISNARALGLEGSHTAEVRHCNAAGGCSLPVNITFTLPAPPTATVFQFTPSPLALGGTSNV